MTKTSRSFGSKSSPITTSLRILSAFTSSPVESFPLWLQPAYASNQHLPAHQSADTARRADERLAGIKPSHVLVQETQLMKNDHIKVYSCLPYHAPDNASVGNKEHSSVTEAAQFFSTQKQISRLRYTIHLSTVSAVSWANRKHTSARFSSDQVRSPCLAASIIKPARQHEANHPREPSSASV